MSLSLSNFTFQRINHSGAPTVFSRQNFSPSSSHLVSISSSADSCFPFRCVQLKTFSGMFFFFIAGSVLPLCGFRRARYLTQDHVAGCCVQAQIFKFYQCKGINKGNKTNYGLFLLFFHLVTLPSLDVFSWLKKKAQ